MRAKDFLLNYQSCDSVSGLFDPMKCNRIQIWIRSCVFYFSSLEKVVILQFLVASKCWNAIIALKWLWCRCPFPTTWDNDYGCGRHVSPIASKRPYLLLKLHAVTGSRSVEQQFSWSSRRSIERLVIAKFNLNVRRHLRSKSHPIDRPRMKLMY